jgi:glycosyltransferase involved in cell wall biosynthesis
MAEKRPKWSVVLIGSAGGSLDVLALSELPNIHLLGVKPYEQALHYIKHFDVAIMPHIKNAISENMNPLKLYVYFALGVPIVTTNVSNIGEIGPHVSIVDTTRQFIKAIEANLNGKGPKVSARARMASLNKVSWKSRVDKVISQLKL